MGSLSEHFDSNMFVCRCGQCRQEVKVSLTLVGVLEDVWAKFNQPLTVKRAYVCDNVELEEPGPKRNYHGIGKAVDISAAAEFLPEIFRYLETFPEITGLGYDPDRQYIHLDLREKEPAKWLYQHGAEKELTPELRAQHGLGAGVTADRGKKSVSLDMPLEVPSVA
ncbi:MAG: hypothetical protein LBJ25_08180 [Candidatus Margulisbacteria bacterium]|jgi:hypothetical protein|nr:hypothetical protein [Candidatus Margulisiibacteriota bacterium]